MSFETHILPNGLKIIHQKTKAPITHVALTVNAGTRDEPEGKEGLAHFIEHCLFKGTAKRKTYHILNRIDAVGGELNAFTSKEETCLYASFLSPYFSRAVELIADICFNSTFPEKEIVKEKEVIADEIASVKDNPSDYIFDEFEEHLFKGHPIGKNILGTQKSLKKLTRQDCMDFMSNHYFPSNMVLSVVGKVPFNRVVQTAERFFSQSQPAGKTREKLELTLPQKFHLTPKQKMYQSHILFGGLAPDMFAKNRLTAILLNNMLGGPAMNSLLNYQVREKNGIAYQIDSYLQAYTDAGYWNIYIGTDKQNIKKAIQLAQKVLTNLAETPLTKVKLNQAKLQLKGNIALAQDNPVNTAIALGKSFLHFNKVDSDEVTFKKIDAISTEKVQELAQEMFDESKQNFLIFGS